MSDRIGFAGTIRSEGRRLRGSVQLLGSRTFRNGEWLEVNPKALMKADATDVIATIDHDLTKVMGRNKNNTLTLNRTEELIEFETADLPNTTAANDALELARGGYFGGASFTIDGLRSTFSTDPDGLRVRTINSIKRLVDVALVIDPAFANSSAAAFSKETDMSDDPQPTPPPEPEPPARFREVPKSSKDEWAAFAKDLSTDQITGQMDAIYTAAKGDLSGEMLDRYEGFAVALDERKKSETEAKIRAERVEAFHNLRMGRVPKAPATELFASDDYSQAFAKYLRTGDKSTMEQFAQTIAGDGSQGGFTVPDGFVNKITARIKDFGGIASVADEIVTSTGESLRWPYIDDTANKAAIVAEDTQATTGADLVFDSVELGAFEYDATGASGNPIEVSLPLLQDSAFDIESLLERLLGERIGRKQADHFATGAGGTEPVGLMSKAADTMTATAASLAAPEHIFQVDAGYRRDNARWVMSDTTLAKLWASQAAGVPLFQPGQTIQGKPFDVLFGYPITVDNSVGNYVAFGNIRAGYIIRRVRGVQLLVDPYSAQKKRAVQYHAWARADANIQDPNAYSVSSWSGVSADT